MHKLVVHYGNGETESIELRNNFSAGSESRVIDLRVIQKIVFWYDTKNLARRNAEYGMRNTECGIRNAECGIRNAECGMASNYSAFRILHSAFNGAP